MIKNIITYGTAIICLCLIVFGFTNWNDPVTVQAEESSNDMAANNEQFVGFYYERVFPNFFYDVGTRFRAIKKGNLDNANTVHDFLHDEQIRSIVSYKSVNVIILENDRHSELRETGNSAMLSTAQIELLRSLDYSTNIKIRADYEHINKDTGKLEDSYSTPHLTIVPEKQAAYTAGKHVLIKYLKENNDPYTAIVQQEKLQPARLYFTVTKNGEISNIKLDRSSGYPSIDKKMIELISQTQGEWEPAEDFKGEKVDQELVISFGSMGC